MLAMNFQAAISLEPRQSPARASMHLTRLISQARIRGGRQERRGAEELQQALGARDA